MSLFHKMVLQKVQEIYETSKGQFKELGPDGYKLAMSSLLGYTPGDWETDEIFRNKSGLTQREFEALVLSRMKMIDISNFIHELFVKLDIDYKGYITINDVRKLWEMIENKPSWGKITYAFHHLSQNDQLSYEDFYEIFTADL